MNGLLKPSIGWLLVFIPVAGYIGRSTEHLAGYAGDAVGGLLNATFGNLPELIITVVALKAGLYEMVAASLIGAISFNLLLALGLSFLIGGYRFRTQTFNATAAATYSAMMFIAVISLALPSMYDQLFASEAKLAEQESLNLGLACILIVLYVLYLFFMLKTHPDTFASVTPGRDAAETEHGPLPGGPRRRVGNGGGAE